MRRAAALLFGAVLMLFGARAVAYAHAMLLSSEPMANAHLTTSPARVRLLFSEEIEPSLAQLTLVSGEGSITHLVVSGDPHDVHAVIAPVTALAAGAYRVVWRVVSADGHPVEGSIVFRVGDATQSAPPVPAALDAPSTWGPAAIGAPLVPALLRGVALGSLMALAGLLFCMAWARADGEIVQSGPARLARGLAFAAPVLLALNLGAWLLNATPDHSITSAATPALLASAVGGVEIWRTGLALLAFWALVLARRQRLGLCFAVAALIVSGASGHSAAMAPMWTEPARAMHLAAGGAWLGALLYLVMLDRSDAGSFAQAALRVSSIALAAAVVVTLSGVLQALFFLASPLDLFRSAYGAILLAKVAGLVILVAFGAYHRYRVMPRLVRDAASSGRFGATVRSEIVVMSVVVLLGGLLAYVSPARSAHSQSQLVPQPQMSSHQHTTPE
jgi:copper transport protein